MARKSSYDFKDFPVKVGREVGSLRMYFRKSACDMNVPHDELRYAGWLFVLDNGKMPMSTSDCLPGASGRWNDAYDGLFDFLPFVRRAADPGYDIWKGVKS
jgi:hypothetical protein